MNPSADTAPPISGMLIRGPDAADLGQARQALLSRLGAQDLEHCIVADAGRDDQGSFVRFSLDPAQAGLWAPGHDTLKLSETLRLDTVHQPADLTREIVVALLMGPMTFEFPSLAELFSGVRIRHNIVQAARKTALAFHTSQAERPEDCWTYVEDTGFVIRPGVSLLTALAKATQPEVSGTLYSFSCYRATEYVILLGIAEELAHCNPELFHQLEDFWTRRPIMSGEFHEVFLREQGSMEMPVPQRYFVPGDRVWFRNPDPASAEASGYEGSWLIYMGAGEFGNFWTRDRPFTLTSKCLEMYQWRHAVHLDAEGNERIDEAKVETLLAATWRDESEISRVLALMQKYREPRGIYRDGGCMDTSREFARWVCPGTADLVLPAE